MLSVWAVINFLKAFFGFGQAVLGEVHDSEQRQAGAAEQTAREGAVIAGREQSGAQISDQVSGLSDKALDDQLKGN